MSGGGVAVVGRSIREEVAEALAPILEASSEWGSLIDPTEYLRDDPSFSWVIGPQNLRSDRARGDNYPIYRTEAEISIIRAIGRALGDCTEHGQAILETMAAYILGCGYQWEMKPTQPSAILASKQIQKVLSDYLDEEKWPCNKEEEFLRRAIRDGEVFVAIMDRAGGGLCLRFVEPSQVTEPTPAAARAICERYGLEYGEWSYGIHTREGDVEDVLGYFVQWTDDADDWSYLPEFRVVHWKRNVDSNVKRGVSDFYPVRHGMRRGQKLQGRLSDVAAVQASIAWVNELPSQTTQQQAENFVANQAARTTFIPNPSTPAATTGQRNNIRNVSTLGANSVLTVTDAKFQAGPVGHAEKATGFIEIFSAQLRTLGVRWNMPEYLISGDASNANYASTLAAGSPFGRSRERDQFKFGQVNLELMRKVLVQMCRRGVFREQGYIEPGKLVLDMTLTYTAPAVQVMDDAAKLAVAQGKIALGVPQKTVLKELGYQPEDLMSVAGVAAPDGTVPAGSEGGAPVADTAMNGTQITSMREIVDAVATGAMPPATAKAMMTVAFPTMSPEEISAIIDPLEGFVPTVGPDGKPLQVAPGASAAGGATPATAAMSRLQQSRNFSTVLDLLNKVASGKTDRNVASVLMRQLAIPDEDIAELLGDAADGKVDSLPAGATTPAPEPAAGESAIDKRAGLIRITTESVHARRMPRTAGIAQIAVMCGIDKEQAAELLGDAGTGTEADEAAIVQRHLAKMWESP